MSASERLKALAREQLREGRWPTFPGDDVVLDALPELIAVVEAAERGRAHSVFLDSGAAELVGWRVTHAQALQAALAALDAKLVNE